MEVCAGTLLDLVETPEDVRRLSPDELGELAAEIREFLIESVSRTGGHLASNLGNVELTVALHYVFSSPRDAIVWDVSHGCYPHKLLTGRRQQFDSLRQIEGLSGYLSPQESEHDVAATGHAGTGLSTALGVAWARRYRAQPGRVAVVVGDGSLPSGMSLEALNNLSSLDSGLTIILNDNGWSIDPTPGALARVLADHRGQSARQFFEQFGLQYLGPADGHDVPQLVELLSYAACQAGPTLIHAVTRKGKGYPPAEADPIRYHAVTAAAESLTLGKPVTYSDVFGETLTELATEDDRVVAVCAAMEGGTGLKEFRQKFPERCFDVGIAEEHAVAFAAALSRQGLRPVVAIYSTFLQRAYDQIVHDVCLAGLPVVFALDRAGCVGSDGPTHHGLFDLAYLRHIPAMSVLAPSSAPELRRHLRAALGAPGPVAIRYPRALSPVEDWGPASDNPFGASRTLRHGDHAAVAVVGAMVPMVLDAAETLSARGIEIEVVEARSVKPLDEKALRDLARRHSVLVAVEDHTIVGGFGSALTELLSESEVHVHRIGWPDRYIEHGNVFALREKYGLDAEGVANRVERVVHETKSACAPDEPSNLPTISSEKARALMNEVCDIPLSRAMEEARQGYERVGERPGFLWKWVLRGLELTTLSCVEAELRDHVRDTKALGVMFDVLIDDVADSGQSPELLEKLVDIPSCEKSVPPALSAPPSEYVGFAEGIWRTIWQRLERYPRYAEFRDTLEYDYAQLMNVMEYSALINRQPRMMNLAEHNAYSPHNMHMMASATIDLMASPRFDVREFGRLREVVWYAQQMGRIGNMVTTWERELVEGDFSSGVFALGLSQGVFDAEDLRSADPDRIRERIREAKIEDVCLEQWEKRRRRILRLAQGINSVDVSSLTTGLEQLILLHLSSRGLK